MPKKTEKTAIEILTESLAFGGIFISEKTMEKHGGQIMCLVSKHCVNNDRVSDFVEYNNLYSTPNANVWIRQGVLYFSRYANRYVASEFTTYKAEEIADCKGWFLKIKGLQGPKLKTQKAKTESKPKVSFL